MKGYLIVLFFFFVVECEDGDWYVDCFVGVGVVDVIDVLFDVVHDFVVIDECFVYCVYVKLWGGLFVEWNNQCEGFFDFLFLGVVVCE